MLVSVLPPAAQSHEVQALSLLPEVLQGRLDERLHQAVNPEKGPVQTRHQELAQRSDEISKRV